MKNSFNPGFVHNIAVANNCTHLLTDVAGVVLVRRKDFGFEVGKIHEGVIDVWHTTDLAVPELCPLPVFLQGKSFHQEGFREI